MTLMSSLLCILALAIGGLDFYCGYRAGREAGRMERDDKLLRKFDPDDSIGRLPSEDGQDDVYDDDDRPTQEIQRVVDDEEFSELGPQEPALWSGQPVQLSVGEDSGRHWRPPGAPLPAWLPSLPGTERFSPASPAEVRT